MSSSVEMACVSDDSANEKTVLLTAKEAQSGGQRGSGADLGTEGGQEAEDIGGTTLEATTASLMTRRRLGRCILSCVGCALIALLGMQGSTLGVLLVPDARRHAGVKSQKDAAIWTNCATSEEEFCTCRGKVVFARKFVEGKPGNGAFTSAAQLMQGEFKERHVDEL